MVKTNMDSNRSSWWRRRRPLCRENGACLPVKQIVALVFLFAVVDWSRYILQNGGVGVLVDGLRSCSRAAFISTSHATTRAKITTLTSTFSSMELERTTNRVKAKATNINSPRRTTQHIPLAAVVNGDISDDIVSSPKRVAVAGATGRTGRLVVEQLLKEQKDVTALVRNIDKANDLLLPMAKKSDARLSIVPCDFSNSNELKQAVVDSDCDAVIWCATGFSDSSENSIVTKLKQLFTQAVLPKQSIDSVGIPAIAEAVREQQQQQGKSASSDNLGVPRVVMLSSAGTTRPSWSDDKKMKLNGCADIPIVRLNPFDILNVKRESEQKLRETGIPYTIVRPCGLNDSQPVGQRPVFSQGDVAVGRINRMDVAKVLVDALSTPEASGKTFEVFTLKGFPPASDGIGSALNKLKRDTEPLTESEVYLTYSLLQQLLPGETQDAAALAMGQTYEELDSNTVGRLGVRGKEDAEAAAPKPSS